jgi:hypothetical protein
MDIEVDKLLSEVEKLIPVYSERFQISKEGSKKFLGLAIIYLARTEYKLKIIEDKIIRGTEGKINNLKKEISDWGTDEFDDEDFGIIGYCQNIR